MTGFGIIWATFYSNIWSHWIEIMTFQLSSKNRDKVCIYERRESFSQSARVEAVCSFSDLLIPPKSQQHRDNIRSAQGEFLRDRFTSVGRQRRIWLLLQLALDEYRVRLDLRRGWRPKNVIDAESFTRSIILTPFLSKQRARCKSTRFIGQNALLTWARKKLFLLLLFFFLRWLLLFWQIFNGKSFSRVRHIHKEVLFHQNGAIFRLSSSAVNRSHSFWPDLNVEDAAAVEQVDPVLRSKSRNSRILFVLQGEEVLRKIPLRLETLWAERTLIRPFRFWKIFW